MIKPRVVFMGKPKVKEKFSEERNLPAIQPKNENQKIALQALYDPSIQVVILDGFAGSGKSALTAWTAGDLFRRNQIEKIIVSRPYVQTGRSSGLKPGDTLSKMYPYVRNILDRVEERIGKGAFLNALKDGERGEIEIQEIESIRGRSFDDPCFLIIDEAQQTTKEEMIAIITRIGESCKLVLCGDPRQKDIKGQSGLEWFSEFYQKNSISGVAHIHFTKEDCVRSGFVKDVLFALEDDNE